MFTLCSNWSRISFARSTPHAASGGSSITWVDFRNSEHAVSAANPACEVSNIAIVDGETLKPEENDHETLRWN